MDKGLDTVTPPILRDTGSLLDCLNYEISDTMGYRRCDGMERYDGFGDGGIAVFYTLTVEAVAPSVPSDIQPGDGLFGKRADDTFSLYDPAPVGIVVEVLSTTLTSASLVVALYSKYNRFPVGHELSFDPSGIVEKYTVSVSPESFSDGYTDATADDYLAKVRQYMSLLRSNVTSSANSVAGLFYGYDRLYKAVDAVRFPIPSGTETPAGGTFSSASVLYRTIGQYAVGLQYYVEAIPISASIYVGTDLERYLPDGSILGPAVPTTGAVTTPGSVFAYLVFANTPETSLEPGTPPTRGDVQLTPAHLLYFENGGNVASTADLEALDSIYISDGTTYSAFGDVTNVVKTDGDWGTSTAEGYLSIELFGGSSPAYPSVGDGIYDSASGNLLATITGTFYPTLPGTGTLTQTGTRYQWGKYNFYAAADRAKVYGTTGASRAFWADTTSYGEIVTQFNTDLDMPKYLSLHCRSQLALAFDVGSVQLSAVGEPYNFNGLDGAVELGMGDNITGMLESQGTSTVVFGVGSISRISGQGVSLQQETISSAAGAFDYTCVAVGSTPVFTNQNGVSTLEQTAAYGDFIGQRASAQVSTKLLPKLIDDTSSLEVGGALCAFPVRAKDQYRLFLKNGDVFSVSFTEQGPKVMLSSYTEVEDGDLPALRVPMAWSSAVGKGGEEFIHVAWDLSAATNGDGTGGVGTLPDPSVTYRLDYGWGYDGTTFQSYFDIAHVFFTGGIATGEVEKVRMHGMGYGLATLNVTTSSLETDYDMSFMSAVQDISMPYKHVMPYKEYSPVTSIIDTAGWGLASKIRINNTLGWGNSLIEPPHTCQVIQLHVTTNGATDS